jgi:hypothetical protein
LKNPARNRRLVVHLTRDISRRKKSEELLAKMLEISKEMVAASSQTQHSGGARLAVFRTRAANPSLIRAGQKLFRDRSRTGGITLPTPRNQRHSINEKLRTHNHLEAVMHAMQNALI